MKAPVMQIWKVASELWIERNMPYMLCRFSVDSNVFSIRYSGNDINDIISEYRLSADCVTDYGLRI